MGEFEVAISGGVWVAAGVSIQQSVDDNDEGVRVFRVVGDCPNRLALRGFDFCSRNAEMDQRSATGCLLGTPNVNAIHQLTRTASRQAQQDEGKQIPTACCLLAQGGAPVGRQSSQGLAFAATFGALACHAFLSQALQRLQVLQLQKQPYVQDFCRFYHRRIQLLRQLLLLRAKEML
ncbi:hypothetical protein Ajs_0837 [Acidovorax sp. JS42]|nr:hypothetical protein Ajs_0837 [Acidovorax sp. JS42]